MNRQKALAILRNDTTGPAAGLLRGVLGIVEPVYAGLMRMRNQLYDGNLLGSCPLGRVTISIGNLTTGGTGKTPLVRWLAEQLCLRGWTPAILLRGYAARKGLGDEEVELRRLLQPVLGDRALVRAGPDRLASARTVLTESPQIDLFLLDDAFQHRRARRDLDLVLINAAEPFGFNHVLPRGLLREPLGGLKRADAVILTRTDGVLAVGIESIIRTIRTYNPAVPIYGTRHTITGWIGPDETVHPADAIVNQPVLLFCGIGDPESFDRQVRGMGGKVIQTRFFPDHHAYTRRDLRDLTAGGQLLVTTEKDWVKIAPLISGIPLPDIWRARLEIQWNDGDDKKLLQQIENRIGQPRIQPERLPNPQLTR